MVLKYGLYDLVIIDDNDEFVSLFKDILKSFNLKVGFVKTLEEFIDIALITNFKFVLCNMHVERYYAGLFLTQIYNKISKFKNEKAKLFFYSFPEKEIFDISDVILDDLAFQRFTNIYDFLNYYFPLKFLKHFSYELFIENKSV